jgi:hypothetical protein
MSASDRILSRLTRDRRRARGRGSVSSAKSRARGGDRARPSPPRSVSVRPEDGLQARVHGERARACVWRLRYLQTLTSLHALASWVCVAPTSWFVTKVEIVSTILVSQPSLAAAPWARLGTIVLLVQSFMADFR